MIRYECGCPVWVVSDDGGPPYLVEAEVRIQGRGRDAVQVQYKNGYIKHVHDDCVAPRVTDLASLRMWREET